MIDIKIGDCREVLKALPDKSVNCCVTSPPYFGLRDYGHDDQIGLEATPEEYVNTLVEVFREVRRVLWDDGTLWLNLGDSYQASSYGKSENNDPKNNKTVGMNKRTVRICEHCGNEYTGTMNQRFCSKQCAGYDNTPRIKKGVLQPKQLIGIPWRVAFALQADGWYLRQDIIWHKPNPMPESVKDRCTKAHEYIFLLSKNKKYYYDIGSIREPLAASTLNDIRSGCKAGRPGKKAHLLVQNGTHGKGGIGDPTKTRAELMNINGRNKRSVWTVNTKPYREAHFATFPIELITPCILAGCPESGTVLDPFGGSGTVGEFCRHNNRNAVLIELNPEYEPLIKSRVMSDTPELNTFVKGD